MSNGILGENSLILAFVRFWDGVEVMRLRATGTLPLPGLRGETLTEWKFRRGFRLIFEN